MVCEGESGGKSLWQSVVPKDHTGKPDNYSNWEEAHEGINIHYDMMGFMVILITLFWGQEIVEGNGAHYVDSKMLVPWIALTTELWRSSRIQTQFGGRTNNSLCLTVNGGGR